MSNNSTTATSRFKDSFNCAQSVFSSLGPSIGLDTDTCLKLATGFGGGIGMNQLTCGAVTGAVMALGLKYGKAENDPESNKEFTYDMVHYFLREFEKKNKSTQCRQILGHDMAKDAEKIEELDLYNTTCVKAVQSAVEIVEKIFNQFENNK